MTPIEILKAGRALIADPARWTQRFFALKGDGCACAHDDPRAVRWCSVGALTKVTPTKVTPPGPDGVDSRVKAGLALGAVCGDLGITTFNDSHTHAEVLAAWDRAIEHLQERNS